MFTGITQGLVRVASASTTTTGKRLVLELAGELAQSLMVGASVSVDGVCLTAVELTAMASAAVDAAAENSAAENSAAENSAPAERTGDARARLGRLHSSPAAALLQVSFDVIGETLRRTTLGSLDKGDFVSVERSLRAGSEIGGHEVSGHVSGTTKVLKDTNAESSGGEVVLCLALPEAWRPYVLPQGFIAIEGSSLTVAAVRPHSFEVHLIPETCRRTKLGRKQAGEFVNVELDARTVAVVTTVERVLEARRGQGQ